MTIKADGVHREWAIEAYTDFLEAMGYEVEKIPAMCSGPSGRNTAERAVDALLEFFGKEQEHFEFTTFDAEGATGMVCLANIEFYSICAHHLLPYYGRAHVGYLPKKKVCGLSKMVRVVDHYAHRPSIQEGLTSKVATFIEEQLEPLGCGVVIEATHMCMSLRGVCRPGHVTVTSDTRGVFVDDATTSNEFHTMIQMAKASRS